MFNLMDYIDLNHLTGTFRDGKIEVNLKPDEIQLGKDVEKLKTALFNLRKLYKKDIIFVVTEDEIKMFESRE